MGVQRSSRRGDSFARVKDPLHRPASRTAAAFCVGLSVAAVVAGSVRVLPWLLEPSVPLRVAVPFARGLTELAIEAAVLVGWPVGFALAAHRFAERGDARVLSLLGEPPVRSALRLWPAALPFAALLAVVSFFGGRDAGAPGRVAQDLVTQGRVACEAATERSTRTVPFVGATWLCASGQRPLLYGHAPGGLGSTVYTASNVSIAGDMRRVDLDDAHLLFGDIQLSVKTLTLRGLSPWAQSSSLPPLLRAALLVLAALASAFAATEAALRRTARGPMGALWLGAAGPLGALFALRGLDRLDAHPPSYLLVPLAALVATVLAGRLLVLLRGQRTWDAQT